MGAGRSPATQGENRETLSNLKEKTGEELKDLKEKASKLLKKDSPPEKKD
jgi:hypothetical protein